MCVRGSHMQLLHMFRRCSPQMEKEKDWACETSVCKCSMSACMYLLLSNMECHVERVRIFIHAQTNTLYVICTNALWPCWFFQFGSKMTLLYSHMALLRLLNSRPSIPQPRVYSARSTRSPPPTQRAASSVEWVFHVYAGMFDQLRHGETKASGDHRWTSNCSALTSCRMNVHAQKRGISARSFFNLHWQTWSSLLILGLLHVPK